MAVFEDLLKLFVPVIGVGILMTLIIGMWSHWLPIIAAIIAVAVLIKVVGK